MPTILIGDPGTVVRPGMSADAYLNVDPWMKAPVDQRPADFPRDQPTPEGEAANLEDAPPEGMNLDVWAQPILRQAWIEVMGYEPSQGALQIVQAISRFESRYGWPDAKRFPNWQGHHNWGSIHCTMREEGRRKSCFQQGGCVKGFPGVDHIDGGPFHTCFDSQPTNLDGAKRFVQEVVAKKAGVRKVIDSGDAYEVALAMRKASYFVPSRNASEETMEKEAATYAGGILGNAKVIAKHLGQPLAVTLNAPRHVSSTPPTGQGDWPRPTTDMTSFEEVKQGTSLGAVVCGLGLGAAIGAGAIWAMRNWRKWRKG